MFQIRKEQMDALAADSLRRFEARALDHLRRSRPEQVEELGNAAEFVRRTTERCVAAEITSEADIVRVLYLLMAFGNHPPPWMDAIMNDPRRAGAARVDAMLARAAEERQLASRGAGTP